MKEMIQILMINNDPENLIIADESNYVLNGGYKLKKEKDGTYSNHVNDSRAVLIKELPIKSSKIVDVDQIWEILDYTKKELKKESLVLANIWVLDQYNGWRLYAKKIPPNLILSMSKSLRDRVLFSNFYVEWLEWGPLESKFSELDTKRRQEFFEKSCLAS